MIFGRRSDIVENDIPTVQRFLDVSRFLSYGGWQVCNSNSFEIKFFRVTMKFGIKQVDRVTVK